MTYLKTIPGFSAYCATKDGKIWSRKTKRFLRPSLSVGYSCVNLYKNSKAHRRQIHRLVLETFVGPCPKGMECCHKNGIRIDNRLKNLRWDTRSNNAKDAVEHGTSPGLRQYNGETNPAAKLKEVDVRMIIYMFRTGLFLQKEIAKIYNVWPTIISKIITKKNWKHIWSISSQKPI